MQSLCTLRNHCRQWPRNTRYQADATPYLGRSSNSGLIPPALPGARSGRDVRFMARPPPSSVRAAFPHTAPTSVCDGNSTCRIRSSACDTLTRFCVRHVLCWSVFPLAPALRSTDSAATAPADRLRSGLSALFVGFPATMTRSDFSCPCIIGFGSSPSRCGPSSGTHATSMARPETSQVPMRSLCT